MKSTAGNRILQSEPSEQQSMHEASIASRRRMPSPTSRDISGITALPSTRQCCGLPGSPGGLRVDRVGPGLGLAALLRQHFDEERIVSFRFSRPTKLHLTYQLLAM